MANTFSMDRVDSVNKRSKEASSFSLASFAENLEPARYGVLVAAILFQGCIVIPAVLLTIQHIDLGLGDIVAMFVSVSSFAVLVVNIGLLNMKIVLYTSIVTFILSLAIIAVHLFSLL